MYMKLLMTCALLAVGLLTGCGSMVNKFDVPRAVTQKCASDDECFVGVYASVGNEGECVVQTLVDDIKVGNRKYPKVTWHLEKADPENDPFDYQFDPVVGIVIVGNVPSQDFEDPKPAGKLKFKTKSVHARPSSFKYTVQVQRSLSYKVSWSPCTLLDPRIINE